MSEKKDKYGFPIKYRYKSNNKNIKNKTLSFDFKKYVYYTLLSILIIFILMSTSLSGYLAWNSFTNDPIFIKLYKVFLAMLFSPVYLSYLYVKTSFFGLPNIK